MSIKQEVRVILNKYPQTKKDDKLLISAMFREKGLCEVLGKRAMYDFEEFFFNEIPCFETIRRSRQLIFQEENKDAV